MGETIKEIPESLRPYEKALRNGPETLDNGELLAVILRNGYRGKSSVSVARSVLQVCNGSLNRLHTLSMEQLTKIPGIGKIKALELKCLGVLSLRMAGERKKELPAFSSPQMVAEAYMEELRHEPQEILKVLYLNTKNRLILEKVMAKGSVNASMVPVREIFVEAFRCEAVYMILLHNHPSGDPEPSEEDLLATKNVSGVGQLTGVFLQDHIIIGDRRYVSLREKGIIQ